jgi:hypothetical protein
VADDDDEERVPDEVTAGRCFTFGRSTCSHPGRDGLYGLCRIACGSPQERRFHEEEHTMADSVIVQSKVKEAVKNLDLRMDSCLPDALNEKVQQLLAAAAERAKANNRGTLRPHDL